MTTTPACPNCGTILQPTPGPPQRAPWLCQECARGWWNSELTAVALAAWVPATRSFGTGPDADSIREQVEQEQADARTRGSNTQEAA